MKEVVDNVGKNESILKAFDNYDGFRSRAFKDATMLMIKLAELDMPDELVKESEVLGFEYSYEFMKRVQTLCRKKVGESLFDERFKRYNEAALG